MDPEIAAPQPIDPSLLARYLSGEADREERARVERWIAASAENRAIVDAMRALWDRPPSPEFDPDDVVWRRLKADITAARPGPAPLAVTADAPERRARPIRRTWPVAAALAALAVGASLAVRVKNSGWELSALGIRSPAREIATRRGERLTLRLADGTRVVLAPESRLRFTEVGDRRHPGAREVELDGEAMFTVTHDSIHPFRVHTANATAEDLGTEFVVTSYPETHGTRVVVASGKVELRHSVPGGTGLAAVTLQHGDLGLVSGERPVTVSSAHGVDVGPYTAWTNGALAFDGTPLREVIPVLRRWYDADIQLARPELAAMKLTATFHDESAAQAATLIAMSLGLQLGRRGGSMVLR